MTRPDPHDLLALAERLARDAARLVRDGRADGVRAVATKSTATDVVTEFDTAAEALIVGGIRSARPGDAVVAEEGTDELGTTGIAWLVDPIDGTTNYLYDLPGYAVSIAARDEAGTLVGVVAVPAWDEVYTAVRGEGARRNGRPIRCSDKADLATALVGTGFGYRAEQRRAQAEVLRTVLGRVRDIRRIGAAATDLCLVASGRLDAYFEAGLGPWDVAAGELIAREAGAVTSDFTGGPPHPGQIVAAGPALHPALLELLGDAGIGVTRPPAS